MRLPVQCQSSFRPSPIVFFLFCFFLSTASSFYQPSNKSLSVLQFAVFLSLLSLAILIICISCISFFVFDLGILCHSVDERVLMLWASTKFLHYSFILCKPIKVSSLKLVLSFGNVFLLPERLLSTFASPFCIVRQDLFTTLLRRSYFFSPFDPGLLTPAEMKLYNMSLTFNHSSFSPF